MSVPEYAKLADAISADIAEGRLKAGDRLPPQRTFAYERKIAVSTASRVYSELLRRGLVVGEVGRGTFIADKPPRAPVLERVADDPRVDFETNYPILPEQSEMIAQSFAGLTGRDSALSAAGLETIGMKQSLRGGSAEMRELCARLLTRGGWAPRPETLVFTGNGRQGIAAAVAALVGPGGRCGVEALTYPFIRGLSTRLAITIAPLAMDESGVRPDAIEKAHREMKLSALYLQPVLHNPLGITMPQARRIEIAKLVEKLNLVVIEDAAYSFLGDDPPLAALAPDHCVVLESMSKRIAPGLSLGFVSTPARLTESIAAAARTGGWTAPGFSFLAMQRFIFDGTATGLVKRKRADARERQKIAAECLSGFDVKADPRAYHLWINLPEHWRAETFVAAAARRGISFTPSSAFAISRGHAPNAIRIALASPPLDRLRDALQTVARMLNGREEDFNYTE